eukprot:4828859-Pyramimonas_sp.AAC.2
MRAQGLRDGVEGGVRDAARHRLRRLRTTKSDEKRKHQMQLYLSHQWEKWHEAVGSEALSTCSSGRWSASGTGSPFGLTGPRYG